MRSAAAWDDQNLYLAWDVRDAHARGSMPRQVPEQMYTSGDTVDFQLGTDPKADKKRDEAVEGDLRLSIGNFQGQPTAVLYRKVVGREEAQAVQLRRGQGLPHGLRRRAGRREDQGPGPPELGLRGRGGRSAGAPSA